MARQVRSDRARLTPADYIPDWIRRGGPGSGHFGHAGRPGQRGGSAPGDGETTISQAEAGFASEEARAGATIKPSGFYRYDQGLSERAERALKEFAEVETPYTVGMKAWLSPRGNLYAVNGDEHSVDARVALGNAQWEDYDKAKDAGVGNSGYEDRPFGVEFMHLGFIRIDVLRDEGYLGVSMADGYKPTLWQAKAIQGVIDSLDAGAYFSAGNVDLWAGERVIEGQAYEDGSAKNTREKFEHALSLRTLPMLQDFAAANWEKVPHFTTSRLGGIQGALWIAPDGSVYDPKVPHFQSAIDAFRGVGKIGDSAALAAQERGDQGMARDLMRAGFVRVAASVPNRMLGFEHPDFHSLTPEQRATIDNESQHAWQQAWTVETDFGGIVKRGGPGSGHFGHAGRPGQRGGSLPGEGGTTISEARRQGLHSAVDALKVPRTEKWRPVSDALAAIDSVHGISGVPLNLKVLALSATSNAGHLRVERGPGHFQIKNMSLRILREGETAEGIPQHLELTTAHEFGHTLDWTAFQGIQKSSGDWGDYDKPMQGSRAVWYLGADNDVYGVMKAIKESEAYTALKVESMPNKAWPGGTEKLVYDSETMRYLREPEELFARAYAQYVAVRSGNEPMLNAVADLQNAAEHGHPPLAWDDKDFQSIAGAFDRMFGERGWR